MKLKIEKLKDCWLINNKYEITFNGTIYYSMDYNGPYKRNFPPFLFEIAKVVKNSKEF